MQNNNLEYILVHNYKCKRCGCHTYDKIFYTGGKLLNDENAILEEKYVCRNCDFPFDINEYKKQDAYNMSYNELLNKSIFVDENEKEKYNDN